jgi:TPR repeat protein
MKPYKILPLVAMLFWIFPDHAAAQQSKWEPSPAIAALIKAAEQGDVKAQLSLGSSYYFGKGVFQDFAEAMKWYRKAADQGEAKAQYNLGDMYANGTGVVRDYTEAVKWYRKAADQGNVKAQLLMGDMYFNGTSVTQDYVLAHMWWNLSATGPKGQAQEMAAKKRDKVAKAMTPQQIAEAQRLAREWKPNKQK